MNDSYVNMQTPKTYNAETKLLQNKTDGGTLAILLASSSASFNDGAL